MILWWSASRNNILALGGLGNFGDFSIHSSYLKMDSRQAAYSSIWYIANKEAPRSPSAAKAQQVALGR